MSSFVKQQCDSCHTDMNDGYRYQMFKTKIGMTNSVMIDIDICMKCSEKIEEKQAIFQWATILGSVEKKYEAELEKVERRYSNQILMLEKPRESEQDSE